VPPYIEKTLRELRIIRKRIRKCSVSGSGAAVSQKYSDKNESWAAGRTQTVLTRHEQSREVRRSNWKRSITNGRASCRRDHAAVLTCRLSVGVDLRRCRRHCVDYRTGRPEQCHVDTDTWVRTVGTESAVVPSTSVVHAAVEWCAPTSWTNRSSVQWRWIRTATCWVADWKHQPTASCSSPPWWWRVNESTSSEFGGV